MIVPEPMTWDVRLAMSDVCIEMLRCHSNGAVADADTVRHWHEWIYNAAVAHRNLAKCCEDIIENGATPENLTAMERALARAMGQDTYCARRDRW